MLGKSKVLDILKKTLNASKADQTEVVLMSEDSYLTRFANSYIHQNVSEHNSILSVRAILGKKIGCATTNIINDISIKETVKRAIEIAKHQVENPDFRSLPESGKIKEINNMIKETLSLTPDDRANAVMKITNQAKKAKVNAYGSFTTGVSEIGIASSLGIMAYNSATDAHCNTIVMSDTGSGYAQSASRNVNKIKTARIGEIAVKKALDSKNPQEVPAGEYEVVLEPTAVANLISFMAWTSFSATAVQEERSFMFGKIGTKVMGENITIIDDAYAEEGFPFPFDFEGVPKQKVVLIENGIAKGIVYDSFTAGKEGKKSTGHALPAPQNYPVPMHIKVKTGNSSLEEMIASTNRGIYVTRFHYVNVLEPMRVVLTGMTRDGTFYIENGKIKKPIKNFRFTQSVLEALNNVSMIGKNQVLVSDDSSYGARFASGILAPPMKIEKFNFSGVTRF